VHLEAGEMITGRKALAKELRVGERRIRTSLQRLKEYENLTIRTTKRYSIISVINWQRYQLIENKSDQVIDQQPTNNRPTTDHKQECKECKNILENSINTILSSENNGDVPYEQIVSLYNRILDELPKVSVVSPGRKRAMAARWNTGKNTREIGWWEEFFDFISQSAFLMGKNSKGWTASFDWIMKPANFVKIVEGTYNKG
jgi:hypothetical protein